MPSTIATLLPLVVFLANFAGAGIAASWLLDQARQHLPQQPAAKVATMPSFAQVCYRLLWTPSRTRIAAFVLASLISLGCSALVALLTGVDVSIALDAALAVIVSQLKHGARLDTAPSYAADRRLAAWTRQNEEEFQQ